jgi:hypothetical protein
MTFFLCGFKYFHGSLPDSPKQRLPQSVFENSLLHARNTLMAHADHPCSCPALLLPSLPCVSAPAPREVQPVAQQRPTEKRPPHAMLAGVCIHLVSM